MSWETVRQSYWCLLKRKINGKKRGFLIAKIDVLKENQLILEKEKEDKNKEDEVQIVQSTAETNNESIVQAMSQVSLRDLEIVGLKMSESKFGWCSHEERIREESVGKQSAPTTNKEASGKFVGHR